MVPTPPRIELKNRLVELGLKSNRCWFCGEPSPSATRYIDYSISHYDEKKREYLVEKKGRCLIHKECLRIYIL